MAVPILTVVSIIPYVGIFTGIASFIIMIILFNKWKNAASTIIAVTTLRVNLCQKSSALIALLFVFHHPNPGRLFPLPAGAKSSTSSAGW